MSCQFVLNVISYVIRSIRLVDKGSAEGPKVENSKDGGGGGGGGEAEYVSI